MTKKQQVSYGYPMGMIWVSYGKGCMRTGKWVLFTKEMCAVKETTDDTLITNLQYNGVC